MWWSHFETTSLVCLELQVREEITDLCILIVILLVNVNIEPFQMILYVLNIGDNGHLFIYKPVMCCD